MASLVAQLVKNPPAMQESWVRSLGWEDSLEKEQLPTPVFWPGESHGLYSPRTHKEREHLSLSWASLVAQLVKNPPAMQWVPFLGWEDSLKKEWPGRSILAWRTPGTV